LGRGGGKWGNGAANTLCRKGRYAGEKLGTSWKGNRGGLGDCFRMKDKTLKRCTGKRGLKKTKILPKASKGSDQERRSLPNKKGYPSLVRVKIAEGGESGKQRGNINGRRKRRTKDLTEEELKDI